MGLETGTRVPDLVPTNPVGATDFVSQGDDHIRLIKAAIQGSFPSLGSGQCAASAVELGYCDGVTSAIQTQMDAKASTAAVAAGYQPLDSDLTAIAALATSSYGRGFLTLADDAATASKIAGMVPTWSQLHTFTHEPSSSLNGGVLLSAAIPMLALRQTGAGTDAKVWDIIAFGEQLLIRTATDAGAGNKAVLSAARTGAAVTVITYGNSTDKPAHVFEGSAQIKNSTNSATNLLVAGSARGVRLGQSATLSEVSGVDQTGSGSYQPLMVNGSTLALSIAAADALTINANRQVAIAAPVSGVALDVAGSIKGALVNSTSTTLVAGQLHHITGNATLPALAAGEWVGIVNNSGSPITITEHSGDTTYWTATAASISTVTVPARGRIVASGAGSSVVYVSGDISGST